jgi:hypothetical protein
MPRSSFFRLVACALALSSCLSFGAAQAAAALGAAGLEARHASLAPQLASNAFGGPIHLESQEQQRRIDGDVYAVLDHPFARVRTALAEPDRWGEILILHLNTKACRRTEKGGSPLLEVRVGKKEEQAPGDATLLSFGWRPVAAQPDYLLVAMGAPEGPYGTHDYQLMAEAVPLPGNRTFLHLGYGLAYGGASQLAMQLYLGTLGRDKVGFTRTRAAGAVGSGDFIGGMRGCRRAQHHALLPGDRRLPGRPVGAAAAAAGTAPAHLVRCHREVPAAVA